MNYQQDYITVIAQTDRFKVNRHLIEKHDNYFSALARWPQNRFNDFTKKNEIIVDCHPDVFRKILDFLTTGECEFSKDDKSDLLHYANYFCMYSFQIYIKGINQINDIPEDYFRCYKEETYYRINFNKLFQTENIDDKVLIKITDDFTIPVVNFSLRRNKMTILNKFHHNKQCISQYIGKECFYSLPVFKKRFHEKTRFLFDEMNFKKEDFNNLFIAGGSVLNCLTQPSLNINDIDIFIYGLNEQEATLKIKWLVEKLCKYGIDHININNHLYHQSKRCIYRSEDAITIELLPSWYMPKIQIIYSRLYKTKSEILLGFDIDCCCCGFDLENVYMLKKTLFSLQHKINIAGIDKSRFSNSYENRLYKYSKRMFAVYIPGLRYDNLKYTDHIPLFEKKGLCKLLYLHSHNVNQHLYANAYRGLTYDDYHKLTHKPDCESNYSCIKIPDSQSAIDFIDKIVTNPRLNLEEIVFPIVFIRFGIKNTDAYKNIFDFDNINNEYATEDSLAINTELTRLFNIIYDFHNANDIPDNIFEDIEILKSNLKQLNDEIISKREPYSPDQNVFSYIYPKHNYYDTKFIKTYNLKTSLNPKKLKFKTDNPGKQIIKGTYAKEYDFFGQAYGIHQKYFKLDMSAMIDDFE